MRGKRKKGQPNHNPNLLRGQIDSKSKHTNVKRCCETLTETLSIKCAHHFYGIYRPVWLCLSVPCLSPVGWSFSISNTEIQSQIPAHEVRQGVGHTEITSPYLRLFPLSLGCPSPFPFLCTHPAFTGMLLLPFHLCTGLTLTLQPPLPAQCSLLSLCTATAWL